MRDANYEALKILISVLPLPKKTMDAFMEKARKHEDPLKVLISVLPKEMREAFMEKARKHVEPDVRWLANKTTYGRLLPFMDE